MNYNLFLKQLKTNKRKVLFYQLLLFILFIFLWQLLSDYNIINSFITSSPKRIIITIIKLYKQNNLFCHIYTTIKEVIISFSLTCILSIIISIILYNTHIMQVKE